MKIKILTCLLALIFVWVGFAGCTSFHKDSALSRESESLRQSVERFYTYKKQGEFLKAFQYERCSLDGSTRPEEYASGISRSGITIHDFQVLEIGEEGKGPGGYTAVTVKLVTSWPVHLNMDFPESNRETVFDDLWTRKEGTWYHVIKGLTKDW